jgi:hypothetical protein
MEFFFHPPEKGRLPLGDGNYGEGDGKEVVCIEKLNQWRSSRV